VPTADGPAGTPVGLDCYAEPTDRDAPTSRTYPGCWAAHSSSTACSRCRSPTSRPRNHASSGRTHRHRLNRRGDRAANSALYTVVLVRLRHHERTRAYAARRTKEGPSKREIMRCLIG